MSDEVILIDDDSLVHLTWRMSAEAAARKLIAFRSSSEFFAVAESLSRDIPVYVDSNLGENLTGDAIAAKICKMGFRTVYIETGYPAWTIEKPEGVTAIVGKDPPF